MTVDFLSTIRHNLPLKQLLITDILQPFFIDNLLNSIDPKGDKDCAEDMIIGQDKVQRQALICSIFAYLIKITDVEYIKVIIKNFLVSDYDKQLAYNVCNMVFVLRQMLTNCYIT